MRTKVTLALIFLNVALFFFIFKFERKWRTEAATLESRRRVLGAEAADIRSLEVKSSAANASYRLARDRDTWVMKEPFDWPANQHAVTSIVNELQLLEHETSFKVADLAQGGLSLADYGLDKPKMTVAFSSKDPAASALLSGGPTVLRIGDTTKDGKRLYVLSPAGDKVHVVSRTLADSLSVPLDQLRADTLLSVLVFEARSVLIVQGGATSSDPAHSSAGVRVRIRRDGTRWMFDAPITARASKTAVELAINELNALRAKTFLPVSAAPAPSAAPALRVTIEGNNRLETLFIGDPVPAPTGVPANPNAAKAPLEFYAQIEGRSALFTVVVPAGLLERLRNAQETLREKRILPDFETSTVTAVTLTSPVQPNLPPLTLQRLEAPAGQTGNAAPTWQIVRRSDTTPSGPQTLPADRAAVQKLFERLALLSAEKFKSDAPTNADLEDWGFNRPLREFTIAAGQSTPIVLRLGTDAARNVYARLGPPNENSIYQVDPEILNDFPLNPLAWRDRAVAEPLPASARITALKLTDLENKQVLYETTFNATGEPTTPPRDPKAARDVVTALRALRAKEFVPGGFTDKGVAAAGDERPWRFELDATVALAGAAGAEQTSTLTLFLTERLSGSQQFAGLKPLDAVFALEQPFVDALWSLAYGARDPGTRLEKKE